MKKLLILLLLCSCGTDDVYVQPTDKTSTISPIDGYNTELVIGLDTIKTTKPVSIRYVKQ